jgi:hypothetical protein
MPVHIRVQEVKDCASSLLRNPTPAPRKRNSVSVRLGGGEVGVLLRQPGGFEGEEPPSGGSSLWPTVGG